MKKRIPAAPLSFHSRFSISILKYPISLLAAVLLTFSSFGTNYYNATGSTNANNLASWTTDAAGGAGTAPADFTSGDIFTIRAATNLNTNGTWTVSGTGSGIVIEGTLTLSNPLTINGSFTNNGTFNHGNQLVTIGTGGDISGTGTITFFNLTISTANTADIVTLSKPLITIRGGNGSANGRLTLNQGILKVGAGNTINFDNNSSENSIVNPNATGTSNLASTGTNGEDGGKIVALNGSGANFTISGNGLTTFYDLSIGTTVGQGNRTIVQTNPNVLINGTLTILDNQGKWRNNSPLWGPNSILSRNNNNQQYTPGGNDTKEWISMTTGTIGVTPGYPNNVIIMNVGTSASNYSGETYGVRLSGNWAINGALQAGSSTVTGYVDLGPGTNFTCGGIIIENGSRLRGSDAAGSFIVKGNFLRAGATNGAYNAGNGTVNFAGAGTLSAPQTITASNGSATLFNNLTVSNGTYVKLNSPATTGTTGLFTLISGIIETSTANILSVTNTSNTAIVGGSNTSFINGPVKWNLASTTSNSYVFPVGKNTTYLPFTLAPNTSTATIATAEAFDTNCGGTPDGTTIASLSTTEYWSLSTTASFTSGASVSVSRPTPITPFNGLGKSSTVNGVYSSVGGTAGTNTVTNSANIGTASPWFFALGVAPLAVQVVSTVSPSCLVPTATVTVAGTGGTPPYTYQLDNTGGFTSNATFSGLQPGTVHTVTVRDSETPVPGTASVTFTAPSLVNIVNNDTTVCSGSSVNLQATGQGTGYSWSPATGLSATNIANPVATPTATTTYVVTSQITTNLLANPDFEAGNTGFASDYIYLSGAQIPYVFAGAVVGNPHNGIYAIVATNNGLCTQFNPTLNDHTTGTGLMLVSDGPDDGTAATTRIWSQQVNGLSTNTNYTFSYWLRSAAAGTPAQIQTKINGVVVTGGTNPVNSTTAWVQVSYTWNSGATTAATIDLYDLDNNDIGNDFMIDDVAFLTTCTVTDSVTITVGNGAAPTVSITQPTCTVATGTITVTAPATGVTYSFDNGVTFQAGSTSPALSPGTYQVVVNTGSCVSSATSATIDPAPTAPAAPTVTVTQPTCTVATGTITVTAPTTGVTYSFDNGTTFQAGATSNALNTGTYQVVVNAGGCQSPATAATINAVPVTPAAPTVTVTQPSCTVATGTITVTSPTTGVTYSFDNGTTFQAGAASAALNTGSYQVIVRSTDGCNSGATPATVNAQPQVPTVDAGTGQTISSGGSVTLNATASPGTYSWSPGTGLSNTGILNPVASPATTTTYTLTVTANGCSVSDNVIVTVETGDCFSVPKIFTPNGDGFYDKWILFSGSCLKQLTVDVYNRWGGLVYHSQNYDNSWEGTRSGKPLPDATYYYVIKAYYNNGHFKTVTGNVTLMR